MILTFIIGVLINTNTPKKDPLKFPIFNKEMILVEETRVPKPQVININIKKINKYEKVHLYRCRMVWTM